MRSAGRVVGRRDLWRSIHHAVVATLDARMILVARDQQERVPTNIRVSATYRGPSARNLSPIIDPVCTNSSNPEWGGTSSFRSTPGPPFSQSEAVV